LHQTNRRAIASAAPLRLAEIALARVRPSARIAVQNFGLGIPNFRMATVTTTPQRVEQMIEAQMEITSGRGSNMFLFIDEANLQASNLLDAVWLTGKGERIRLTD
jgi:hypothetical protein